MERPARPLDKPAVIDGLAVSGVDVMPTALVISMLLFLSLEPYRFAKQTAVSEADRRPRS